MNEFSRKVAAAVAPVVGVTIAISILLAAGLPFPPPLSLDAWAQWAVFGAVVYAGTGLCMYAAGRVFGPPGGNGGISRAPDGA